MKPGYLLLSILFFSTVVFYACREKKEDLVPYKFVDFTMDLNSPLTSNLTAIGGHIEVDNQGVKGIVIYRAGPNNEDYKAYDKNCSYKPLEGCAVKVDSNNITATDACCGSVFLLTDGSPSKAPAERFLQPYRVSISGSTMRINNY